MSIMIAEMSSGTSEPPHILARHICRDMCGGTYPYSGALYIFRGRRGDLIKILFWDRQGMCLYAKKLDRGCFIWPQAKDGVVTLTMAQLSMLRLACHGLDGKARSCCLNAGICASAAVCSGTHVANRIGSRDGGSAIA
jgi:hypothetical protein